MKSTSGTIRIISGRFRGRRIAFPKGVAIRPSKDSVRETLFNWLTPHIKHSICLDMFAGSGALGLEAISRGADQVWFLDRSSKVIQYLKQLFTTLPAPEGCAHRWTLPQTIPGESPKFNIVFIDPPFEQNLLTECCDWLEKNHYLADNALIYIETEKDLIPLPIPEHWQILKQKCEGTVRYSLCQRLQGEW